VKTVVQGAIGRLGRLLGDEIRLSFIALQMRLLMHGAGQLMARSSRFGTLAVN